MKSKTCGFDKEKWSKNCYADNSKKLGGELEKIKGERTVKKWMSKAAGCLSLAAMLMLPLAASVSAEIPAKPEGNASLITGAPVIPEAAGGIYTYADNTLSVPGQPGDMYYVSYPLASSLEADDSYGIAVDVSITARYDEYMGPAVIFRQNTDGKLLGLWFQRDTLYCGVFTAAENGGFALESTLGNINNPLADGSSGTLKIYTTPTRINFSVLDEDGNPVTLTYEQGGTDYDIGPEHGWDVAGGAPAFGIAVKGTSCAFSGTEVYDTVPAPVDPGDDGDGDDDGEQGGDTGDGEDGGEEPTEPEKPPVDARPEQVPDASGCTNLLTNSTPFRTAAEGYSFKDGVLKGIGDPVLTREFGRFQLSGLSADDTYLFSLKMKVNTHFDEYSGCYIGFRGVDGKDFYAMGFQATGLYLMDYQSNDYANGASFTVVQQAPFALQDGKEYQIDIFTTPTKVSLFVDGALMLDYVTVEKQDIMPSVLSANANFELSDIRLYNLSQGAGGGSVNTGVDGVKVVLVCALVPAAVACLAVTRRRAVRR